MTADPRHLGQVTRCRFCPDQRRLIADLREQVEKWRSIATGQADRRAELQRAVEHLERENIALRREVATLDQLRRDQEPAA